MILEDGTGRVKVGLDAQTRLASDKAPLTGTAMASAKVVYDKSAGAFYLEDATIESLNVGGLSEKWTKIAAKLGTLGAREYLNRHPVCKLNPDDVKQNLVKCVLKDVKIKDKKLILTLGLGD